LGYNIFCALASAATRRPRVSHLGRGSRARPGDLDGLSHAELKGLVVTQWEEMVELQRMVVALRDEIARLKGGSGRPNIKPSCMEQATEPKPPGSSSDQRRGRASTRSKLSIHEERTVKVAAHQTPMSESFTV
jgi:hypothetical protein